MNQRGFSYVLIILSVVTVLGLVAGIYYLSTQKTRTQLNSRLSQQSPPPATQGSLTTDESAKNWKIYTSQRYRFQILHPENVKVSEDSDFVDFIIEPIEKMNVGGGVSARIRIVDNSNGTSSMREVHKDIVGYDCNTEYGGKCEDITFNGKSALKVTDFINLVDDLAIYIPTEKRVYILSTQKEELLPNQILSTFKLLD